MRNNSLIPPCAQATGYPTPAFNRELTNTKCNTVLLITYCQTAAIARLSGSSGLSGLFGLFGYLACLVFRLNELTK